MRILSEKPCGFCGTPILVPTGPKYNVQCGHCSNWNVNPPPQTQKPGKEDPRLSSPVAVDAVEEPVEEVVEETKVEKAPLWNPRDTKKTLLALCKDLDITAKAAMTKRQIMKALEEAGYPPGPSEE